MAGLHFLLESKLVPHSGTYSIRESDLSSCRLSEINAWLKRLIVCCWDAKFCEKKNDSGSISPRSNPPPLLLPLLFKQRSDWSHTPSIARIIIYHSGSSKGNKKKSRILHFDDLFLSLIQEALEPGIIYPRYKLQVVYNLICILMFSSVKKLQIVLAMLGWLHGLFYSYLWQVIANVYVDN